MIRKNFALAVVLALTTLSYVTMAAAGGAPVPGHSLHLPERPVCAAAVIAQPVPYRVRCAGATPVLLAQSDVTDPKRQ